MAIKWVDSDNSIRKPEDQIWILSKINIWENITAAWFHFAILIIDNWKGFNSEKINRNNFSFCVLIYTDCLSKLQELGYSSVTYPKTKQLRIIKMFTNNSQAFDFLPLQITRSLGQWEFLTSEISNYLHGFISIVGSVQLFFERQTLLLFWK